MLTLLKMTMKKRVLQHRNLRGKHLPSDIFSISKVCPVLGQESEPLQLPGPWKSQVQNYHHGQPTAWFPTRSTKSATSRVCLTSPSPRSGRLIEKSLMFSMLLSLLLIISGPASIVTEVPMRGWEWHLRCPASS